MPEKGTLILGIGNDILSDDRIGPQLVRDLAPVMKSENLYFKAAASGGFEIVEYLREFNRVIIIDAIHTREGTPGDVHCFVPSELTGANYLPAFHDIDFITAYKLSEALIPHTFEIHIIAIEILEDSVFSEELTPPLREKYPEILTKVSALISSITGKGNI